MKSQRMERIHEEDNYLYRKKSEYRDLTQHLLDL